MPAIPRNDSGLTLSARDISPRTKQKMIEAARRLRVPVPCVAGRVLRAVEDRLEELYRSGLELELEENTLDVAEHA